MVIEWHHHIAAANSVVALIKLTINNPDTY
jgi:hypothetical protein